MGSSVGPRQSYQHVYNERTKFEILPPLTGSTGVRSVHPRSVLEFLCESMAKFDVVTGAGSATANWRNT